jgi:hypothetical protein
VDTPLELVKEMKIQAKAPKNLPSFCIELHPARFHPDLIFDIGERKFAQPVFIQSSEF